jgi:hypothetical protein
VNIGEGKIMNKIIVTCIVMTYVSASIYAMEKTARADCIIVDHNNAQENITVVIKEKPSVIGIFGSTPRYSEFEKYITVLKKEYAALLAHYKRGKVLKGVAGPVKKFIRSLAKYPEYLEKFEAHLNGAYPVDLMPLFFAAGFDHKVLKDNIGVLLRTINGACAEFHRRYSKNNGQLGPLYYVHLFVPSYFADVPQLKDNPQHLHAFLKASANFYKGMYDNVACESPLKMCLLIPKTDHFLTMFSHGTVTDKTVKFTINTDVVDKEIIKVVGSDNGFMLLNVNGKELVPMCEQLIKKGVEKQMGVEIPITDKTGYQRITSFTKRVLRPGLNPDTKDSYKTSPLFNEQLLVYVENTFKEVAHV